MSGSLVEPALASQGRAWIVVRTRMIGIEPERFVVVVDCFSELDAILDRRLPVARVIYGCVVTDPVA